ncbi:acyl-CoA N-acyltransferase [Athelia psychrophila]|uniref:Acyl-CoA N-acyltransferase n=1 Tax=Athelia psychrophila TaxID=1759441 RepID=A0A166KXC9_9AGAM|nr:acyl-CoA N-acyltransferase [Fibularhizoctonia sp. CBS 109695]
MSSRPAPAPIKTKPVELHTPRLLLREARLTDAADLFAVMGDAINMRYCSSKAHEKVADTAAWLAEAMIATPFNGRTDFVIVLAVPPPASASEPQSEPKSEPKSKSKPATRSTTRATVVGKIGCWNGQELGVQLHRAHWGRGYASEALAALLAHMWATTDVRAITADVDPRNSGSLRLLRRFGFAVEREEKNTMETHIGWCDSVYLRLARPAAGG